MPEFDNTNRGAIFVNNRKTKDTHPDRSGSINVEGKEYWLDGWTKMDKSGNPFMSLSVKPKEDKAVATEPAADGDAPIPF